MDYIFLLLGTLGRFYWTADAVNSPLLDVGIYFCIPINILMLFFKDGLKLLGSILYLSNLVVRFLRWDLNSV